jgi:hypothetical protein
VTGVRGLAIVFCFVDGLVFFICLGTYIGLNRDKPILEPGNRTKQQRENRVLYFRKGRDATLPKVRAILVISGLLLVVGAVVATLA